VGERKARELMVANRRNHIFHITLNIAISYPFIPLPFIQRAQNINKISNH
jgi:hypothetical protein